MLDAAGALGRVLEKLDAQQEALNAKVDRIVAAVEEQMMEQDEQGAKAGDQELQNKIAELEKQNADLKAQAARLTRKTLPPIIACLLSKQASEMEEKLDAGVLDKTLQALTVEQRIAVKAEMARAGMIE